MAGTDVDSAVFVEMEFIAGDRRFILAAFHHAGDYFSGGFDGHDHSNDPINDAGGCRQDYIRTARAKGASEFRIVYKHALRNALLRL